MKNIVTLILCLTVFARGATFAFAGAPALPKRLATFLHEGEVISMAFSPDSRHIVAGSKGIEDLSEKFWHGRIKVWDAQTHKHVSSFDLPRWVQSISFSPHDPLLAVGCGSANWHSDKKYLDYEPKPGEVCILSFPKLKEVKKFQHGSMVKQVLFSRDGKFFAASALSPELSASVWSAADWKRVRHIENPVAMARSSEGPSFLYAARPADALGLYRIVQIDPEREEREDKIVVTFDKGHTPASVESIVLYKKADRLIYHTGGVVRIVDTKNGKEDTPQALIKSQFAICKNYTVSEDGRWLACLVSRPTMATVPRGHGWVVLWDLVEHKQLSAWAWPEERVGLTRVAISPDNKLLAVGNQKSHFIKGVRHCGEVVLYDISKLASR